MIMVAFVIAFGFVTAAFVASASSAVQNGNGSVILTLDTPVAALRSFMLCMVVGPYVVGKNALLLWMEGRIGRSIFGACFIVALTWSFCLGIVVVQLLLRTGVL